MITGALCGAGNILSRHPRPFIKTAGLAQVPVKARVVRKGLRNQRQACPFPLIAASPIRADPAAQPLRQPLQRGVNRGVALWCH